MSSQLFTQGSSMKSKFIVTWWQLSKLQAENLVPVTHKLLIRDSNMHPFPASVGLGNKVCCMSILSIFYFICLALYNIETLVYLLRIKKKI